MLVASAISEYTVGRPFLNLIDAQRNLIELRDRYFEASADYLRLADGARFNTVPHTASDQLLSAAPVAAFGFLGSNPGAIAVQGSQLAVAEGTGISLVGGNITIQSGTPDGGTAQPARLSAPNGKIQLASAASPGEFDAATLQPLPNVNNTSFTSFGSVSLAPGSNINVSGEQTVSSLQRANPSPASGYVIVEPSFIDHGKFGMVCLYQSIHPTGLPRDNTSLSASSWDTIPLLASRCRMTRVGPANPSAHSVPS